MDKTFMSINLLNPIIEYVSKKYSVYDERIAALVKPLLAEDQLDEFNELLGTLEGELVQEAARQGLIIGINLGSGAK